VLKPTKKLGQMGPPSWPNKPNPWRANVAVSATSDSMSPCWSGFADVACIHDVSIRHYAVPQNLPKSYSMMIVDITVATRLRRFFRTLNNYDVDSMTVFYTLTDSYLWWFLGCLWPIQTVIYQQNPCSGFVPSGPKAYFFSNTQRFARHCIKKGWPKGLLTMYCICISDLVQTT
jgi:hypothetical protein